MATKKPAKQRVTTIPKVKVRKGKFATTTPKAVGRVNALPTPLSRYRIPT